MRPVLDEPGADLIGTESNCVMAGLGNTARYDSDAINAEKTHFVSVAQSIMKIESNWETNVPPDAWFRFAT